VMDCKGFDFSVKTIKAKTKAKLQGVVSL
jgi:hypothetical protein